jgi:hypothetical protein
MISGVFEAWPPSFVSPHISHGSPSHFTSFAAGKASACFVDLALLAFSFSLDPRISGFLLVFLPADMDICFNRFRFLFSVWCLLSFVYFLSGYTRDMVSLSFFWVLQFHTCPQFHT